MTDLPPLNAGPLADIAKLIANMPGPDLEAAAAVRRRDAQLTKPAGSLGRLEEIAEWLAQWQRRAEPRVDKPTVAVFAANHGVAARNVSAYPPSVTAAMVENFRAGGAAINQICLTHGLALKVLDLALEVPTPDIAETDAFDAAGLAATIAFGMEAVAGEIDLLCVGEMGIGNTTVAAAIGAALYGESADLWVGPGTGVDAAGLDRKRAVVGEAVTRIGSDPVHPMEVLRRLGGREIAAMVGAIIAGRYADAPVIIDGFVATSAAAIVHAISPNGLDHCLFAHVSAEPAHRRFLEKLDARPLLDLGMRLGEGTGAALAAGIVKSAAATHRGMATFEEASVAGKSV
ncbi:MAG: nicotinate-nucleotide--dimethylbenzimidazole phosphoribosyltransferase [Pseudomonadota bacterium]